MARPSIETARAWAPRPIRDRLPGGRRTGLSARLPGGRRTGLSARLPGGRRTGLTARLPGGRSRTGLLDVPKAVTRRRRRQRWMRGRAPSMPSMPSVSMPSVPRPSMPSMPSVSMPSMPRPARRRRRSRRMAGNLGVIVGAGAGYVLGTRAGRERYRQIVEQARRLWQRPQVQDTVAKGRDRVGSGVERAAATAGERLHQAREGTERTPSPSPDGPGRSPSATGTPGPGSPGGAA
jgi:hypothetical protein